jgi:hypothetical protein
MVTGGDVLTFLKPNGGWVIAGDDFESIRWDEGASKITKAEFEAGFAQYDAWKAEQNAQAAANKASAIAKLEALGLTTDDLKALGLGGN